MEVLLSTLSETLLGLAVMQHLKTVTVVDVLLLVERNV
jgi:hypothetical protein